MDIRIKYFTLLGALMVTPVLAAPPPPPAPPSNGASASGQAAAQVETLPQEQQTPGTTTASAEDNIALRGPLHEAFARPVSHDPIQQPVIRREPPKAIEEIPPEYRPDGDNIIWIPGYWSFEESEDEFLWISGLWRDMPPGRRWVPGYWSQVDGGYLWTPGEWISDSQRSLTYLSEPPRSQERGPSSTAPGDDYFWLPGCWEYRDNNYAWRPGYWAPHQRGWLWVPAHYDWTPNGYVYCDGYWDYDIDRRGIVYAPYRYRGRHITGYTPNTVLDVSHLLLHLFVDNRTGGYCFGDYYGRDAYRPWYSYHSSRSGYDPIYSYNSWQHGPDYGNRLTGWNTYFTQHRDFRPRRTLNAQQQFLSRNTNREVAAQVNIARAITGAVGSELFGRRVVGISGAERDSVIRSAGALQSLAGQRLDMESRGRGRASAGNRDSVSVQGQGKVQTESLTLPEVTGAIIRGDQSRGSKAVRTPALPGVTIGEPGNRVGQRPGDNRGKDDSRGKGNVGETIRDAVKGTREGNGVNIPRGAIRESVDSVPGTKNRKDPKAGQKTQPATEPRVEPNPKAKPLPTVKPKPQPKADPAPKPIIPEVKKPKAGNGGNRGGDKPKGKSGGLIPSVPGLK